MQARSEQVSLYEPTPGDVLNETSTAASDNGGGSPVIPVDSIEQYKAAKSASNEKRAEGSKDGKTDEKKEESKEESKDKAKEEAKPGEDEKKKKESNEPSNTPEKKWKEEDKKENVDKFVCICRIVNNIFLLL